jgi:hypothetical protein
VHEEFKALREDARVEWQQEQVRRIASFDPASLNRYLATWKQWLRQCSKPCSSATTEAAKLGQWLSDAKEQAFQRWTQLRWLQSQLGAPIPLDLVRRPEKPVPQKPQAVALEPAIHVAFDQALRELPVGHEHHPVLVAAQVQLMAVLRFRHLQRSRPLRLTQQLLVGYCSQGKAKRHKLRFQWASPRYGPTGTDIGKLAVDQWKRSWRSAAEGWQPLASDIQGNQLTIANFQKAVRSILQLHYAVPNAELFTTYSLRRCYPTVAGMHKASADEQDALGGLAVSPRLRDADPVPGSAA